MPIWGRRVVVLNDDPGTLAALGQALRDQGADVVSVSQPGGALATILGVIPDVILVDVAMPGLDAIGLIRKLRSLSPERGGRIPAAALSASITDADWDTWSAAGFQTRIAKPFALAAVVAVVDELAGERVERRSVGLRREAWPTVRERRSERRDPPETLQGIAGGDPDLLRELILADRRQLS